MDADDITQIIRRLQHAKYGLNNGIAHDDISQYYWNGVAIAIDDMIDMLSDITNTSYGIKSLSIKSVANSLIDMMIDQHHSIADDDTGDWHTLLHDAGYADGLFQVIDVLIELCGSDIASDLFC